MADKEDKQEKKEPLKIEPLECASGKLMADLLVSKAQLYYGFYYNFDDLKDLLMQENDGEQEDIPYATTEEERKQLKECPFVFQRDLIFYSLEEVEKTAALFKERHGENQYNFKDSKLSKDLMNILSEIRIQKFKN